MNSILTGLLNDEWRIQSYRQSILQAQAFVFEEFYGRRLILEKPVIHSQRFELEVISLNELIDRFSKLHSFSHLYPQQSKPPNR